MKSFSSDEGACLIDQEFYMPNYVVLIPLVRAVRHWEPSCLAVVLDGHRRFNFADEEKSVLMRKKGMSSEQL